MALADALIYGGIAMIGRGVADLLAKYSINALGNKQTLAYTQLTGAIMFGILAGMFIINL